jgi:integrase
VPPAPLPDRVPRAWTLDELGAIYRAAAATRGFVGIVPSCVWYPALVSVLWESAERIGAVLECRPDDFDGTHLHVRAEYRKGGKRDRVYRLSSRTCSLLLQARGASRLLEWDKAHTHLWKKYADIVARAGWGVGGTCRFMLCGVRPRATTLLVAAIRCNSSTILARESRTAGISTDA